MKVMIVGASGLLGSVLVPALKAASYNVFTVGRAPTNEFSCDVGDSNSARSLFDELQPDVLINLVALTDVDLCESDSRQAFSVNVRALENIVSWIESAQKNCHLVHISTDQVYDGPGPHCEDDVMLTNYYSFSKYAAELAALRVNSTVLRTNFFGKSMCDHRSSFTDWVHHSATTNRNVVLFGDVFFSPLSMATLAEMVVLVVSQKPSGVFNLGSNCGLSKSEFSILFMKKLKFGMTNIEVASIGDVSFMKTYRPRDMRLNVTKFEQKLDVCLPTLEAEINRVIGDYDEKT